MVYGLSVILDFTTDFFPIKGLTGLIGKNKDHENKDDFDRLYSSMVIQSVLSNVMLNDRFVGGT